jgi:hypothetical protein
LALKIPPRKVHPNGSCSAFGEEEESIWHVYAYDDRSHHRSLIIVQAWREEMERP